MKEPTQPSPAGKPEQGKTIAFSMRQVEARPPAHYLTLIQGVGVRSSVALGTTPLVLGRDASRPFHLGHSSVSRSHCELRLDGERALVRDLGSTNGTFVDGTRIEGEVELPPHAVLQVGEHALRHDLLTLEEVAARERLAAELERARHYVERLIPAPLETGPVRTDWCFVPSSVLGGDALGYNRLADGRLAFYVLDVCGHGVDSAMHSAAVLGVLRSQTLPNTDFGQPGQVLERLDTTFPMDAHAGMYFTLWYGVLDPQSGHLDYASAGHPPAIVLGHDGTPRRLGTRNPPIGALGPRKFAHEEATLTPGERLYVFSDGVHELVDVEGRGRTLDDFEHDLCAHTDRSPGEPWRLYRAALDASGAVLLEDDFTLLTLSIAPMEYEIQEQAPELTRVRLVGRLDSAGVDRIEPRLNATMASGGDGILDLSEVTFLSSLGIRLLIGLAKLHDRRGGRLVLVAPQPLVREALQHSNLDELIPVAQDLEGARALLAS